MRYFITFCYDGKRYHGWQIQPNGITVQEEIQKALSILMKRDITVVGAGRTDTGVHAKNMVAHFDADSLPLSAGQLAYRLNRILPYDISIKDIKAVDDDMHARFSAKSRTYHYYIHTDKNPFLQGRSCEMHFNLDMELMNSAAAKLLDNSDFGAFCKSNSDTKTTLCRVYAAEWHQTSPTSWYFEIKANRFLRNMVRAVVGTLIEVGRHRLSLDEFAKVMESRRRTEAGESMPAHALYLEQIEY